MLENACKHAFRAGFDGAAQRFYSAAASSPFRQFVQQPCLYRLYFEARFESNAGRRLLNLLQGQLRRQLEQLAFRMIAAGKGTAADARWAQRQIGRKALRDGLSLQLLVQDKGVIRFYHQSLHSYFALPGLTKALQKQWIDRWRTKRRIRFIERIGDLREGAAPAVPVLINALRDADMDVRMVAGWALVEIGVDALTEALRDDRQRRYAIAAWAFVEILKHGRQSQQKGGDDNHE